MADDVEINTQALDKLIRLLKNSNYVARVGILGDTNGRDSTTGQTNAEIGAAHEFGTSRVPRRSFLKDPIEEHLGGHVEKGKDFDEDSLKAAVADGTIKSWFSKLAKLGESIVLEAFATGGFGKWKPHSSTYTNTTGQILVDTQQLRNSITSDVKRV